MANTKNSTTTRKATSVVKNLKAPKPLVIIFHRLCQMTILRMWRPARCDCRRRKRGRSKLGRWDFWPAPGGTRRWHVQPNKWRMGFFHRHSVTSPMRRARSSLKLLTCKGFLNWIVTGLACTSSLTKPFTSEKGGTCQSSDVGKAHDWFFYFSDTFIVLTSCQ